MAAARAEFSRRTVHQVHGAKLAADIIIIIIIIIIITAAVSSVLLWRGRTVPGLLVAAQLRTG
jgi:uncharacterized iron-regulated membrane protein